MYTCSDNSDKIFPATNSTCLDIAIAQATRYCDTFCKPDSVFGGTRCASVCYDKKGWLSKQNNTHIINAHDCQSSCQKPKYNCLACTHPNFNFTCFRGSQLVCLHKDLVCDGHPQCDMAEDEKLDNCLKILLDKKLISSEATLRCSSIMYENMETVVEACNGSYDCVDHSDESWLCTNNNAIIYIIIGLSIIIFIILIILKFQSQRNQSKLGPIQQRPGKAKEDIKSLLQNRDEEHFWLKVNVQVMRNQYLEDEDERQEINKIIYGTELAFHNYNLAKTRCSLKSNLELEACKIVIDDAFPGCINRITKGIKLRRKLEVMFFNLEWLFWIINKIREIVRNYLDVLKDVYLLFIIFITLGGVPALISFSTRMSSILVYCLFCSVFIPINISSLFLALQRVEDEKNESKMIITLRRKFIIIVKTLMLSFLNPLGRILHQLQG